MLTSIKAVARLPNGLNGSQDFLQTFSMGLYHNWDVKNGFAYVLQFFSLISDCLGGVTQVSNKGRGEVLKSTRDTNLDKSLTPTL